MADKELPNKRCEVIDLSLCPSPIEIDDSDDTPVRPIFCVKNKENAKNLEKSEECFILDFDPDDEDLDSSKKLDARKNLENSFAADVCVVSEKGKVACRDFPHPRHLCVKFQFEKTDHASYCNLCYCYVCDSPAPCKNWTGLSAHCHAIDNAAWKFQRATIHALKTQI